MRPIILAALMTVTLAACSSQPPEEAALEAAAMALGATAVNTIQYSGSGLNSCPDRVAGNRIVDDMFHLLDIL